MTAILVLAALAGCRSSLDPGETTGGTDGTDGGSGSSGDTGDGASLVINGSFEDWAGGTPVGWTPTASATLEMSTDDPADGSRALRLIAPEYVEVRQSVSFPEPVGPGTVVAVEMQYRRIDGDTTQVGVDLYGILASQEEVLLDPVVTPPFAANGWTAGGGSVVPSEELVGVRVTLVAGGLAAQTVEIDDVRLTLP